VAAQTFDVSKMYWKAFGLRAFRRCIGELAGFFFLAKF